MVVTEAMIHGVEKQLYTNESNEITVDSVGDFVLRSADHAIDTYFTIEEMYAIIEIMKRKKLESLLSKE